MDRGQLRPELAWRMILLGGISNLAFKAGIVVSAGHRDLRRPVLSAFTASAALGFALMWLWP